MASNLYINYFVNQTWHVEGFAIYNLIKRLSSFIVFPLLIGTGIGIPRYIGLIKSKNAQPSFEYLIAGIGLFSGAFLGFTVFILFFPGLFLEAMENSGFGKEKIILAILLFIYSQGLLVLLTSYFKGRFQFGFVSLVQILLMSVLPTLTLFVVNDILAYFLCCAIITLLILAFCIVILARTRAWFLSTMKVKLIRLFRYGYPRIIAELGLFSLEFLPIYIISVAIGLTQSGYLSMCFLLLKLASMVYELIGNLVLPYFSKWVSQLSRVEFNRRVSRFIYGGLALAVLITLMFYVGIPIFIKDFFPALSPAIPAAQQIFLVFPFYALYLMLRHVLDAVTTKAYNSYNLAFASVVQVLVLVYGVYQDNPLVYGVFSVMIPYLMVGVLSVYSWLKEKKRPHYTLKS